MRAFLASILLAASLCLGGCQGIVDQWQAMDVLVINATGEERLLALAHTTDPQNQEARYAVPADGRWHRLRSVALGSMEATDLSGWIFVYDSDCQEIERKEVKPGLYAVTLTPTDIEVVARDSAAAGPAADYLDPIDRACFP